MTHLNSPDAQLNILMIGYQLGKVFRPSTNDYTITERLVLVSYSPGKLTLGAARNSPLKQTSC